MRIQLVIVLGGAVVVASAAGPVPAEPRPSEHLDAARAFWQEHPGQPLPEDLARAFWQREHVHAR